MKLDKEEHREILLALIGNALVQGRIADVEKAVDAAREVREAVINAGTEEQ